MELEVIKKLIKKHAPYHANMISKTATAERYYKNENDILHAAKKEEDENPIRSADNRIPSNFHGLLVNQKAAYAFTSPPLFDIGEKETNKKITELLGDRYAKACKDLCINASNSGVGWLHYWIDKEKGFQYGIVDTAQIIPVWTSNLNKELNGVLRIYDETNDNGEIYTIYEFWSNKECEAFQRKSDSPLEDGLCPYNMFAFGIADTESYEMRNSYQHEFKAVPFIPFFNNNICTSDLDNIKRLIDTYDKVFSGFVNDLEDIQEIILVLSGYGGTDLAAFLKDLKKYKAIKVDEEEGSKPGVSTLTIDIPVEAREKLLIMTRKAIFEQGQGIDPQPENFGDSSGVALKFLYSLLELKTGLMETEFKLAFGDLVRAICLYLKKDCKTITQTWTRTAITNDTDLATIASTSVGVISKKTILINHPWVEDADKEEEQIKKEEEEESARAAKEAESSYGGAFTATADKTKDPNKDTVVENQGKENQVK